MTASKPPEFILPPSVRRPAWLVGVWIVPQIILFILNIRTYTLVDGDLSTEQARLFAVFFGCETMLLLIGVAVVATLTARQKLLRWAASIPILLLHLGFLVLATFWVGDGLLPSSATLWIMPPERMIFTQFALIMPVVFYAAATLAAFSAPFSLGKDIGLTVGAAIGVPAVTYFLFTVVLEFFGRSGGEMVEVIFTLILVTATVITCIGLLRVLLLLRRWTRSKGGGAVFALNLCVALLLPIGGLLVNAHIPFPYDFQAPAVYLLAALNGILLLIPATGTRVPPRLVWLAQAILFPFTLYFFLVFLPFTPLSLLAMFWFFCGFFVLAPTFLFLLHGSRLLEGFRRERVVIGLGPALAVLVLAVSVVPVAYTARALFHKRQIHQAIDYVYSANPAAPEPFAGRLGAIRQTLRSLQAANQGFELPFVTSYYQWIVFDNLVLPEKKLQQMHQAFFGEPLEDSQKTKGIMADMFPSRSRNEWTRTRRRTSPPTRAVQDRVEWKIEPEGDQTRALAIVTLRNPGSQLAEFVTPIHVPPGVMLSGYWLHIGTQRVAGRIFEKKAAQWIYRMIRDTGPRDPGLLVYQQPDLAELRVYPLNAGEVRTTEIEFLFPKGWAPDIRIGDCPIEGLVPSDSPTPIASSAAGVGLVLALPTSDEAKIPTVQRQPVLHFILDRSAGNEQTLQEQLKLAEGIAHRHPDAEGALVTLANFEAVDLNQQPISPDSLTTLAADKPTLPTRGGFVRDRMVARALLQHQERCRGPEGAIWAMRYPRIIVLQAPDTEPVAGPDLTWFRPLCPDEPMIRVHRQSETAKRIPLDPSAPKWTAPKPVTVVRAGETYAAAADGMVCLPGASADAEIALYDPEQRDFRPHPMEKASRESRYAQGSSTWLRYYRKTWHTSADADDLTELVAVSRDTGVLTPATSYIVLENEAQWAMLERKEQQKLANDEALDLMTTPEPETWVLLGGFIAVQCFRRRRSRRLPSKLGA